MKKNILYGLFLLLPFSMYGQTTDPACDCPINEFIRTKAEATFQFSNGEILAACGHKDSNRTPPTFTEFVIAVCGEDKVIDFWDAMTVCQLAFENDTLFVQELYTLPTGANFDLQETVWTVEKIYFSANELQRTKAVNQNIRKYNDEEIRSVLEAYKNAGPEFDDGKMRIAYQLFVAALSNNKEAKTSFMQFRERFDLPNGAYSQEYRILQEMLEIWEGN